MTDTAWSRSFAGINFHFADLTLSLKGMHHKNCNIGVLFCTILCINNFIRLVYQNIFALYSVHCTVYSVTKHGVDLFVLKTQISLQLLKYLLNYFRLTISCLGWFISRNKNAKKSRDIVSFSCQIFFNYVHCFIICN